MFFSVLFFCSSLSCLWPCLALVLVRKLLVVAYLLVHCRARRFTNLRAIHQELAISQKQEFDDKGFSNAIDTIWVKSFNDAADALTNLTVLVKTSNREYIISREPITVEINSKSSVALDWAPDETGIQWIEVRWNDEYLGHRSNGFFGERIGY